MCWPFHVVLTPVVFALLVVATLVVGLKVLLIFGRVLSGSLADADGDDRPGRLPNPGAGAWMPGMCTSSDCRHLNPPHARYCGRCGRKLER